jgi:hypothetical protein
VFRWSSRAVGWLPIPTHLPNFFAVGSARLVHIGRNQAGPFPTLPKNLNPFAVELMGIEPTASRVRF